MARRSRLILTDTAGVLGMMAVAALMLSFFGGTELSMSNWLNQPEIDRVSHL